MPPPAKVLALALVRLMVPVPVTVRLVDVEALHAPVVPAIDQVPEPMAIVLVSVPDAATEAAAPDKVTLNVAASNVPFVRVNTPAKDWLAANASCSVTDPPGVSMVNACVKVLPALVIV